MEKDIKLVYQSLTPEELSPSDQRLVEKAKKATLYSYAPFSQFHVGCALELEGDIILTGNNQENASFPCGLCAERTTIFYAHANYPDNAPVTIAIAARAKDGEFIQRPLPPCGACRQSLLEMEQLYNKPLRMILYGTNEVIIVPNIHSLLPFQFEAEMME